MTIPLTPRLTACSIWLPLGDADLAEIAIEGQGETGALGDRLGPTADRDGRHKEPGAPVRETIEKQDLGDGQARRAVRSLA